MNFKPAPIYLLINGETDGPHHAKSLIVRRDLDLNTLSCIEGMKGWRVLSETFIYSAAKLFQGIPSVWEWVQTVATNGNNINDRKLDGIYSLLDGLQLPREFGQYLKKAVLTNAILGNAVEGYNRRAGGFCEESLKFYPIGEFEPFDKTQLYRNWTQEWINAGGQVSQGRMMARKNDPCWLKLNDFGYPVSPFCFGRDGFVNNCSISEAKELGFNFDDSPIILPEIKPFTIVGI